MTDDPRMTALVAELRDLVAQWQADTKPPTHSRYDEGIVDGFVTCRGELDAILDRYEADAEGGWASALRARRASGRLKANSPKD